MMAIFLFVIWVSFYYLRVFTSQKNQYITFLLPLGFFVGMLSWWYFASTQVEDVTKIIAEALNYDITAYSPIPDIVTNATIINSFEFLLINLGLYLFIGMSLIGFFYMISRKGNNFTFYFALFSMIPVFIYILLYFLGGFVYAKNFNLLSDRWINLIQLVICVPLAFSIYSLSTYKIRDSNFVSFVLGAVIILLSLVMIMTPSGSPDNHGLVPEKPYWSYYTESEMSGNDFFGYNSIGDIYSDRVHAISPSSSVFEHVYGINRDRLHMLDFNIQSGLFEHDNSIKIFRSKRILEFQRVGVFSPIIQPDLDTYLSNRGFNKIYENPMMTGYNG
jgi:hypothetical protein